METYKRVFVIVLDSLGIGAMPDSEKFGDKGVDTFGHILDKMGTLDIPNLQKLGMLNLHKGGTMEGVENPIGRYMRIGETSNGKDTMTGHWEMMGIYTQKPFITFTETGFPKELIDELEKRCGKRVIGNKSDSGTEIPVAAVVHGGTIMAVLSSLTGGEYFDFQVKNGEGYETVLEWIQGSWKITSLTKIGCEDSKSEHLQ